MNVKMILLIVYAILFMILLACGSKKSFHDLREYIAQIDKSSNVTERVKHVTIVQPPTPVTYQKEATRTPFEENINETGPQKSQSNNPINAYPINLLRFVGTVTQGEKTWAYVMTPDNKVYQITIGDRIGNHDGKVVKINSGTIEVIEQSGDEEKQGAQRIVTLQLKDES